MSNRATCILVVLCVGALNLFLAAGSFAQNESKAESPVGPKAPPLPAVPSGSASANESEKTLQQPTSPSVPVKKIDSEADERLKRLADRFSKDQPASKPRFNAADDQAIPTSTSSKSNQSSSQTASQKKAAINAEQTNRLKLVDPADLEPLGPRQNTPAGVAEPDKDFGTTGGWVLNLVTALGVVLVLVFLLRSTIGRWFVKAAGSSSSPVVEVLTRVSVAPRNHVLLLRVGNRILIVGDSSAGLRTLGEVNDAEEVADLLTNVTSAKSASSASGFRNMLQGFNGEYSAEDEREALGGDESEIHVDRTRDRLSGLMGRLRSITKGGER